jgi:hypothetical protein
MKTMKKINKVYSNSLLILLVVAASFFSTPSIGVYAGTDTPPTITIDTPVDNDIIHQMTVKLSGTFSDVNDNIKISDLFFSAEDLTTGTKSNPESNPDDWKLSDSVTSGTWTFTKKLTQEGPHNIIIKIEENLPHPATNVNQDSVTFSIDTRPYILNTGVIYKDNNQYTLQTDESLKTIAENQLHDSTLWTDIAKINDLASPTKDTILPQGSKIDLPTVRAGEDLTYIPKDAMIKLQIADDKAMQKFVSNFDDPSYNPIKVMLNNNPVEGTATIIENTAKENSNYVYDIFFKLKPNTYLTLNQTYLVYLDPKDPKLVDDSADSNGLVYSKFFKFTTRSNGNWDDIDNQSHGSPNPHGHYQLNTNMCATCHTTHVSSPYEKGITKQPTESREGGSYLIDFNSELDQKASENYCTACHDGTLNNAPIVNGIEGDYHHDNPADYSNGKNKLKDASSCTSCHNPHLDGSESNPNLLIDHYVYTHNAADQGQNGLANLVVDSLDTSCETCHEDNLIHNSNGTDTDIYDMQSGGYQVLSYKKSLTANGNITNYSLCLRCHKPKKDGTDIETFYLNSNSGHKFTLPSEDEGSQLNGQMPCSECHETHGANNIKMLRDKYGNDPETTDIFSKKTTDWTPSDERTFCLKCHDNKTEIYGKVGTFDDTITGHAVGYKEGTTEEGCSYCHGGTSKTFIEAAHAPQTP